MKKTGIGTGVLVGVIFSAPLLGVLYLASEFVDLPFPPYDMFDRLTRELPGPVVTFGIDVMIDTLRFFGLGISEAAKVGERAIAVLQFLIGGMVAAVLYFRFIGDANRRRAIATGAAAGAAVGGLMAVLSIGIGGSSVNSALVVLWLAATFGTWGAAHGG